MNVDLFVNFLISWAPLLLLVGFWGYMCNKGYSKQREYYEKCSEYMTEHVIESKKLNQHLERIAFALEQRQTRADAMATKPGDE